jgi:ribonucleoside-diphosphate reductase beta chain
VGLEPLHRNLENPLPWLSEMMEIKKETNFFEGRVTEYRRGIDLAGVSDDEL